MRNTKMLFTLGLVLLLAGCGPEDFLNPLYTRNDLVTDPLLTGAWEKKGDGGTSVLEFEPGQSGCYTLNTAWFTKDTGKPDQQEKPVYGELNACLVQLGQTRFLDVQSVKVELRSTTKEFQLALSSHPGNGRSFEPAVLHMDEGFFATLAPVGGSDRSGETQPKYELRLTPAHWILRIWVDQTTLRLSDFEPPDDVGTLSTDELQKLVLRYADDAEVFSSDGEWHRKAGDLQAQQ